MHHILSISVTFYLIILLAGFVLSPTSVSSAHDYRSSIQNVKRSPGNSYNNDDDDYNNEMDDNSAYRDRNKNHPNRNNPSEPFHENEVTVSYIVIPISVCIGVLCISVIIIACITLFCCNPRHQNLSRVSTSKTLPEEPVPPSYSQTNLSSDVRENPPVYSEILITAGTKTTC